MKLGFVPVALMLSSLLASTLALPTSPQIAELKVVDVKTAHRRAVPSSYGDVYSHDALGGRDVPLAGPRKQVDNTCALAL